MENELQNKTILIVDDEAVNLTVLEAMLLPLGCTVVKAGNGEDGLNILRESHPDVVLLDAMMSGLDGFEFLRQVKANPATRRIPVVMVTALSQTRDRVRAFEMGADDFLSKPVDKSELRARVRSLVKVKEFHDHMIRHQVRLEREVARQTAALQESYERIKVASLDTILRLSRAAEFRDEETGNHIHRMSHIAQVIARQLGLDDERILYAAPMHDIGKIGIPDHILRKPGKLSVEEWEVMQTHTTIGAHILSGSDVGYLQTAYNIAIAHHEKWDGSGYPRGLAGEDIPMESRIAAVADVFDALTSVRPYRQQPFALNQATAMIEEQAGTMFDPQVVEVFLAVQDDVWKIKLQDATGVCSLV